MARCRNKSIVSAFLISFGLLSVAAASAQDHRVVQLAKLEIDSSQLESYNRCLREGIESALQLEPGVLMLYAVAEKSHPTHITIIEIYSDSAAYHSHLQTAHFLRYKSQTAAMVKHLELIPVIPLVPYMKIK